MREPFRKDAGRGGSVPGGGSGTAPQQPGRPVLPTPPQLFRLLERGEITHAQLQKAMACHASLLFEEMEECRRNPLLEFIERRLTRRACDRLVAHHGESRVRTVLLALAEVSKFPPARYLWHAGSANVPLHCILRTRREPVLRILGIEETAPEFLTVKLEHGPAKRRQAIREHFVLERQANGLRRVVSRQWVN